jgi:RNA polymerase sigma-70 factor (ECF subfamily)
VVPEQQVERLRGQLVLSVRKTCPPWLRSEADDLVQTALLRVLDANPGGGGGEGTDQVSSFYLRKAAYSAVVDEIRRRKRRREVPLDDDEGAPVPVQSFTPDPERRSAAREAGRAIRGCLGELVRPRRHAVTLYLQGYRIKEVGGAMGWDRKRAENLIYRGLADLRHCLEGRGVQL